MDVLNLAAMTWTCHVCGDERPDDKISVCHSEIHSTGPDGRSRPVAIQQNVRYCNDRPACAEGAPLIRFVK